MHSHENLCFLGLTLDIPYHLAYFSSPSQRLVGYVTAVNSQWATFHILETGDNVMVNLQNLKSAQESSAQYVFSQLELRF